VVPHNNKHQRGLVMIAMLLLVFMAGTSMYFVSMSDRHGDIKNIVNYNNEMVSAKEALIAYAMNYADIHPTSASSNLGPGRLPCPDVDRDGTPEESCEGGSELIFRLPVSVQKSGTGDPFYFSRAYTEGPTNTEYSHFWYAVSPDFAASNDPVYTLNSATDGLLTVNNKNDYVAVVIAPGEVHNNQSRTTDSNRNNRNNYLEAPNNNTDTGIFSSYADNVDDFNDRVMGITRSELMTAVTMKVVIEIKRVLDSHYESYEGHPFTAFYDYECSSGTHCYPREEVPPATSCFFCSFFGLPQLPAPANVPRYETVMADAVDDSSMAAWYEDDDWEGVITYEKISDNVVTLDFAECAIVYTLRYNTEPKIERSANSC
jgi:hypothetical protein